MLPSVPRPPDGRPGGGADFGRYAGLGLQYALTVVLLTGLGWWLDARWETTPWLLVVGAVLGSVAGFVNLVRAVPRSRPRPNSTRPRE
ncbi:MAG: AtpZ/AtpI family protein [Planctomycetes bacterium]|nr:AtpZ/AtpI family protein [Planctomycetota bacterium]